MRMFKQLPTTNELGQNLVEFALVLPVLLILMIGGYNVGLLLLRLSDAAYVAQVSAASAARFGGYTPAVWHTVDEQIKSSFLGSDQANVSWRLDTVLPNDQSCLGNTFQVGTSTADSGGCTCSWGDQVKLVVTYRWKLNAVLYTWEGSYEAEKRALCWRGTTRMEGIP